jgi:hypothetical protein
LDVNQNGVYNAGEQFAITSSNGTYFLADLMPGVQRIEIEIVDEGTANASWILTTPTIGYREVNLRPGETISGQSFGVGNRANRDWGDLPSSYITRSDDSAVGGPNHIIIPGFQLGSKIDGEVNGIPTTGADGDDLVAQDEDGVRIISNNGSLRVGPNILEFALAGVGGYLNGWIDLNDDGNFDLGEQVITNIDLNPGTRQLIVNIPAGTATGPLAARFRWGEFGLSFDGPAEIGEVEDYLLSNSIVQAVVLAGDYTLDGAVNDYDYALWRSLFGTTDLRADGNGDGSVDMADYVVWRNNKGATSGTGTVASSSSVGADSGFFASIAPTAATVGMVVHSNLSVATVTGSASENVESVTVDTPFFVGLPFDAVGLPSDTSGEMVGSAAVVQSAADSSLLLLEQALADLGSGDDRSAEDDVWCNQDGEDESVSDLALAAVLDDEAAWWATL